MTFQTNDPALARFESWMTGFLTQPPMHQRTPARLRGSPGMHTVN